MPDPFQHISHRVSNSGSARGRSMRDGMMDEAARFSRDIKDAMAGKLEPEKREKELGVARILKIFSLSKGPKVCGCIVDKGVVKVGGKSRVYRNNELIFNGEVRSLRRFQDDVKEVRQGMECGIKLDNFLDFNEVPAGLLVGLMHSLQRRTGQLELTARLQTDDAAFGTVLSL